MRSRLTSLLVVAALAGACDDDAPPAAAPSASAPPSAASSTPPAAAATVHTGSGLALASSGLVLADEDRRALWSLPLPLGKAAPRRVDLDGHPAQVVVQHDRVLVTMRDPGALSIRSLDLRTEQRRISLPADAWGLAVRGDLALVTSAWSHQVSAIDLAQGKVRWSVDVAREPRAVVLVGDRAYVSHAVGAPLTRIDGLGAAKPTVKRVPLPPAPSRAPRGQPGASASFGLSLAVDSQRERLWVARQALGALVGHADGGWAGAATVDGLDLRDDSPVSAPRPGGRAALLEDFEKDTFAQVMSMPTTFFTQHPMGPTPIAAANVFVQPTATIVRQKTDTILVASQGSDQLVELDALAIEPALFPIKRYPLGAGYEKVVQVAKHGGAPSAMVLSEDEDTAFVWCRSTFDVLAVPLVDVAAHSGNVAPTRVRLGDDPLLEGLAKNDPQRAFREAAAAGRRLFYNAVDPGMSEWMGCHGCHIDGRDDGHVWIETSIEAGGAAFVSSPAMAKLHAPAEYALLVVRSSIVDPRPRQTPMLAGRVEMKRRFGWRGESEDLPARIEAGFALHRLGTPWQEIGDLEGRARALAAFVLKGLTPPPRPERPLTPREERGKALFEDTRVGCADCHVPATGFTLGQPMRIAAPAATPGLLDESGEAFLVPSLRYVGGTPPYYHDGSAPSLAALIDENHDRMGHTAHLSPDDRAALVAYLETL